MRPLIATVVALVALTAQHERIELASDGWQLFGDWQVPQSTRQVPAVLLAHKAAGSRGEYEKLARALAERGIASLRLDLRGHGDSVNLGRFEEPYAEHRSILDGTHEDVEVALNWLRAQPQVARARIGVVAASYSGEAVAVAVRDKSVTAAAYVMLSPGSFSDESIASVDPSGVPWLFVRTREEGPRSVEFIDAVFDAVRSQSETAVIREIPGAGHASDILERHPFVVDEIADWLGDVMGSEP